MDRPTEFEGGSVVNSRPRPIGKRTGPLRWIQGGRFALVQNFGERAVTISRSMGEFHVLPASSKTAPPVASRCVGTTGDELADDCRGDRTRWLWDGFVRLARSSSNTVTRRSRLPARSDRVGACGEQQVLPVHDYGLGSTVVTWGQFGRVAVERGDEVGIVGGCAPGEGGGAYGFIVATI